MFLDGITVLEDLSEVSENMMSVTMLIYVCIFLGVVVIGIMLYSWCKVYLMDVVFGMGLTFSDVFHKENSKRYKGEILIALIVAAGCVTIGLVSLICCVTRVENVHILHRYEILIDDDVLTEKDIEENYTILKRFNDVKFIIECKK